MTEKTNLIYTADWHLGLRQYGLKRREYDRYESAWQIIRKATELKVRAILNGGDLLDKTLPTSRAVNTLNKMHEFLIEKKIPMFVVQGNHDRTDPPWFELFSSGKYDSGGIVLLEDRQVVLPETENAPSVSVYGLPEMTGGKMIEKMKEIPDSDILLTHVSVKDWTGFPPGDSSIQIKDIPSGKFKHVVIGDTHKTEIAKRSNTFVISPGSVELGPKDEPVEKFFWYADSRNLNKEPGKEMLKTRPVRFVEIKDEEEMRKSMDEVEKADKNGSLVFVEYNPNIVNVAGRLYSCVSNENTILNMSSKIWETGDNGEQHCDSGNSNEEETLRTLDSFASNVCGDEIVIRAFRKTIDDKTDIDGLVEEIERETLNEKKEPECAGSNT